MIRMLVVGNVFAIRSERLICREVQVNLAYRWFCKLGIEDAVPDHSAFSRARNERLRDGDVFRRVFERVVEACITAGLVGGQGTSGRAPALLRPSRPPKSPRPKAHQSLLRHSLQNLIFKSNAFRVVFLKPFFRSVRGGEDLDVLGLANLFAGVDVDKNDHRQILYALVFFNLGVAFGFGLPAFNARSIPTRVRRRGPRPSAAMITASMACQCSFSCSALGNFRIRLAAYGSQGRDLQTRWTKPSVWKRTAPARGCGHRTGTAQHEGPFAGSASNKRNPRSFTENTDL